MSDVTLLREKHVARLESLIKENAPYEEILKQSQIVDEFITEEVKKMLKQEVVK